MQREANPASRSLFRSQSGLNYRASLEKRQPGSPLRPLQRFGTHDTPDSASPARPSAGRRTNSLGRNTLRPSLTQSRPPIHGTAQRGSQRLRTSKSEIEELGSVERQSEGETPTPSLDEEHPTQAPTNCEEMSGDELDEEMEERSEGGDRRSVSLGSSNPATARLSRDRDRSSLSGGGAKRPTSMRNHSLSLGRNSATKATVAVLGAIGSSHQSNSPRSSRFSAGIGRMSQPLKSLMSPKRVTAAPKLSQLEKSRSSPAEQTVTTNNNNNNRNPGSPARPSLSSPGSPLHGRLPSIGGRPLPHQPPSVPRPAALTPSRSVTLPRGTKLSIGSPRRTPLAGNQAIPTTPGNRSSGRFQKGAGVTTASPVRPRRFLGRKPNPPSRGASGKGIAAPPSLSVRNSARLSVRIPSASESPAVPTDSAQAAAEGESGGEDHGSDPSTVGPAEQTGRDESPATPRSVETHTARQSIQSSTEGDSPGIRRRVEPQRPLPHSRSHGGSGQAAVGSPHRRSMELGTPARRTTRSASPAPTASPTSSPSRSPARFLGRKSGGKQSRAASPSTPNRGASPSSPKRTLLGLRSRVQRKSAEVTAAATSPPRVSARAGRGREKDREEGTSPSSPSRDHVGSRSPSPSLVRLSMKRLPAASPIAIKLGGDTKSVTADRISDVKSTPNRHSLRSVRSPPSSPSRREGPNSPTHPRSPSAGLASPRIGSPSTSPGNKRHSSRTPTRTGTREREHSPEPPLEEVPEPLREPGATPSASKTPAVSIPNGKQKTVSPVTHSNGSAADTSDSTTGAQTGSPRSQPSGLDVPEFKDKTAARSHKLKLLLGDFKKQDIIVNHSEPNSARQGNDYEYFLNVIVPQPKQKSYFDITVEELSEVFVFSENIGSGGYSTVRRATEIKTGKEYAVKIVAKEVYDRHEIRMKAEAAVLGAADHPHIVKFYGVVRSPNHVCFVMELLTGGELFDHIIEHKYGYPEPEACHLITGILEAVEHLHDRGIVHRDIKPENFLFKEPGARGLKLIDFGFATFQHPHRDMIGSSCGTPDYIAPELLVERPHNQSVDMWSVGVVLFILLSGSPPFFAPTDDELFDLIAVGEYKFNPRQWESVSDSAVSLVTSLLHIDPKQRLTAKDALRHPWIVKNNLLSSRDMLNRKIGSRSK